MDRSGSSNKRGRRPMAEQVATTMPRKRPSGNSCRKEEEPGTAGNGRLLPVGGRWRGGPGRARGRKPRCGAGGGACCAEGLRRMGRQPCPAERRGRVPRNALSGRPVLARTSGLPELQVWNRGVKTIQLKRLLKTFSLI